MNNKAVLSFNSNISKNVKYGYWVSNLGNLYFNGCKVAERLKDGTIKVYPKTLTDCGHSYQKFHAIDKVVKFLNNK